jgi:hypothetical protein
VNLLSPQHDSAVNMSRSMMGGPRWISFIRHSLGTKPAVESTSSAIGMDGRIAHGRGARKGARGKKARNGVMDSNTMMGNSGA